MTTRKLPTVVLVGRTNVGKSTLFNKITETSAALVSDIAGTTRDSHYRRLQWRDTSFTLIDTGGLEQSPASEIETSVQRQALKVIESADVICFLIDGKTGVVKEDRQIARRIRTKPNVLLVVNKLDSPRAFTAM
ncbi:MAG: GTPase, partial [Patescibacteria group bacterium]